MSVKAELVGQPIVRIEMPMDVAETLLDLTGWVAGDPGYTYRWHTDAIAEALSLAGLEHKQERFEASSGLRAKEIKAGQ